MSSAVYLFQSCSKIHRWAVTHITIKRNLHASDSVEWYIKVKTLKTVKNYNRWLFVYRDTILQTVFTRRYSYRRSCCCRVRKYPNYETVICNQPCGWQWRSCKCIASLCIVQELNLFKHAPGMHIYMMYVKLIEYYLILTRSMRTVDFNLLKFIMSKIRNLIFFQWTIFIMRVGC